jgi:hypothetical protein
MKALFLPIAVATIIGLTSVTYGQQSSAPPAGPRFTTCSQHFEYCNSNCRGTGPGHRACLGNCQERQTDCMATGFWTNPNTGQKLPRQRQ